MNTCPECGHLNAPGTQFCASCQAYLGWAEPEGEAANAPDRPGPATPGPAAGTTPDAAAPGPAAGTAPDAAARATGPDTPRRPSWGRDGAGEDRSDGRSAETQNPQHTAPAVPPMPRHSPRPTPVPPAASAPEAASSPAVTPRRPGDGPGTDADPGRHEEGPPASPPRPAPPFASGRSRRCPHCRAANPADRRLCTRCDGVLDPARAAAPASPRLPWWRRIMRPASERRLAAGSRPSHRRLPRPRLALPLLLIVLAAVAWFARPQLAELFDFAKDTTGKPQGLQVTDPRASSSARGHSAGAAFDKLSNRYWAPAEAGTGSVPWIEASFEKPVRLQKLLITPGSSAKQDEYLEQARPSKVTLTIRSSDGERSTRSLTLKDEAGDQSFDVRGSDVVNVRVTVEDAFGVRPGRRVAIAELEFFGRG